MLNLTRFMLLVAVALMVARPVMACCLTGHGAPAAMEMMTESPPCHDAGRGMVHDPINAQPDMPDPLDCPGCSDCDSTAMQAQAFQDGTLLTPNLSEVPAGALIAQFTGFDQPSIVLKTGPPGDPPAAYTSPVTLKQRLLI